MKRLQHFACVAFAAASLFSQPLFAQGWETVLDYQFPGGSASGHAVAADASGNVFSAGHGSDAAGITRGLVFKTDTTQANWFLSDDNNPSISQFESMIWDCGFDSHGNLYSVGQLWPNSSPGVAYWYVRKSSDGGLNWSTLYEPDGSLYQYTPGQWIYPTGFAADASGNIYVVGGGRDATVVGSGKQAKVQSNIHWLVRKSSDGGQTWRLVDDLVTGPIADAAAVVPGAGVFVVGAHFTSQWIVRRSATGEPGTWSTVAGPIDKAAAHGVCGDTQGNIYVAGEQFIATGTAKNKGQTQTTGYTAWVTRRSSDGGNTWTTVDSSSTWAPNVSSVPRHVGRDAAGRMVVVGSSADAQGNRWIVRTPDSSGVWQTVDDFQLAPGYHSRALGVAKDAAGNLLVTGFGNDASGDHWIVRRLASNP